VGLVRHGDCVWCCCCMVCGAISIAPLIEAWSAHKRTHAPLLIHPGRSNAATFCPEGTGNVPLDVLPGFYTLGGDPSNSTRSEQRVCEAGSYCKSGIKRVCPVGRFGATQVRRGLHVGTISFDTMSVAGRHFGRSQWLTCVGVSCWPTNRGLRTPCAQGGVQRGPSVRR
jgi:hypothetical protein